MLVELTHAAQPSAAFGTERTVRAEFGIDAQTADGFDGTVVGLALACVGQR